MVAENILKHLLCDDESLLAYFRSGDLSIGDLRRRMFLKQRAEDRSIPDHYYRLQEELTFKSIDSIGDALSIGILRLAEEHLEMTNGTIKVQIDKQNQWQELITYMPPLILQMVLLQKKHPLNFSAKDDLEKYYSDHILANIRHTALCEPDITPFSDLIIKEKGFDDLHIHLNGTTETDIAWQDFLTAPKKIHDELSKVYNVPGVREQFEQESHFLTPNKFFRLLNIARKIRAELCFNLISKRKLNRKSQIHFVTGLIRSVNTEGGSYRHPLSKILNPSTSIRSQYPVAEEGLLYVMLFEDMASNHDAFRDKLFHFYLLILGLANRLLVQQKHQFGFEQFQKHTLNSLREISELRFENRLFQLHGNQSRNLHFLEGRFSPKTSEGKTIEFLTAFTADLKNFEKECNRLGAVTPVVRLVAHFIKRKDLNPDRYVRHKDLRKEVWLKAKVLVYLKKKDLKLARRIVGIDAAASEFDASPEVFAPAFRMLRRREFKHFTFHAGEDFHHLVSGLRAIFEAIEFNDLQEGDRIGHATATGLSPMVWLNAVGSNLLIRQGEWLDNLLFCRYLMLGSHIDDTAGHLAQLNIEIQRFSANLGIGFTAEDLQNAWLARKYCPILLRERSVRDAINLPTFDKAEWNDLALVRQSNNVVTILEHYHNQSNREAYDTITTVDHTGLFDAENMQRLQRAVLKIMKDKNIIIETLPSSNIRIGHHRDFSTYQLWNWNKWAAEDGNIPPVVLGTDDPGIFATNIYNEYASLYCYLTTQKKQLPAVAMKTINTLHDNGRKYRFG